MAFPPLLGTGKFVVLPKLPMIRWGLERRRKRGSGVVVENSAKRHGGGWKKRGRGGSG
jgi:hypothetical protein